MSDDLQRLARRLEEDAARLSGGQLSDEEAVAVAESIAQAAAEAATLVDRALRAPGPEPRAPGQSTLPVDD